MSSFLRATVFTRVPLWVLCLTLTLCALAHALSGLNVCAMWALPAVFLTGTVAVLSGLLTAGELRLSRLAAPTAALLPQFLRHAVERLSDTAGDSGEGVAVTAKGHRCAESVFKTCAFQKCNNSLRHGFLAALHMVIGRANLIAAATEIVAKLALHIRLDFRFSVTCASEKDRRRSSLRALDALRRSYCASLHAMEETLEIGRASCRERV